MNDSEKILSAFSEMRFYKELVLSKLIFTLDGSTEKELADLLVNGGDFIIAIQLKSRNDKDQTFDDERESHWLTKKCKAAKKQIKETIEYLQSGQLPSFENGRKKQVQLSEKAEIIPLIVFMNDGIGDNYAHVLFRHSEEGMDLNCMSFSDFQEMCNILYSPLEIVEYLKWRLLFFQKNGDVSISMYVDKDDNITMVKPTRGEALCYQFVAEQYGIKSEQETQIYVEFFAKMLQDLPDRIVFESEYDSSYSLILFFAHFNRLEIKEFVERIYRTLSTAQERKNTITGSLRNVGQRYVIMFVSSYDGNVIKLDYLEEIAKEKGDFDILLEVVCYWINNDEYNIDYAFLDLSNRYL